jgi:hypothetical protein
MLIVDPDRRITFEQLWGHPWVRGAARWEPLGASIYQVTTDPSSGEEGRHSQQSSDSEEIRGDQRILVKSSIVHLQSALVRIPPEAVGFNNSFLAHP